MLRLTLDTGCVIHGSQAQLHRHEVDQLVGLARAGRVGLWLTTAFDYDQSRADADSHATNLQWLSERPIIGKLPGPFRFNLSQFSGSDLLSEDETAEADEQIKEILRPSYKRGGPFPDRKINDVHHLSAHRMAKHDAFVTTDGDDILRRRMELADRLGIEVVTLPEAIAMVARNTQL